MIVGQRSSSPISKVPAQVPPVPLLPGGERLAGGSNNLKAAGMLAAPRGLGELKERNP